MNSAKQIKTSSRRKGQSMLEVIVASGVIVTAVSAALTLVQSSINGAKTSEEQIVAFNLARESIEVARQIRDSNWLAGRNFHEGILGPSYELILVQVFDPATNSWSSAYDNVDWVDDTVRVYKQTVVEDDVPVGLYRQAEAQPNGTTATNYRRRVQLYQLCDDPANTTANFIAYTRYDSEAPCPAGTELIGLELNADVTWPRKGGGENLARVTERIFDWR